ncbi:MAG TPA: DNA-3-methyladenine glycosylase 2 family protein [Candidatus Paceibacterota bacterium]|nr:DNA-3-methyladenine glycosylase 2 family protein [Candidatus Paceibacterota bacterium]
MDTRTRAFQHFRRVDTRFHEAVRAHQAALPAELARRKGRTELFAALCRTVVSQQLGVAAARSILARVKAACGGRITVESVGRARSARLRAAGLSGAKTKTLRAAAAAVRSGRIDLPGLRHLAEDEAKSRLTEMWGIGPWSAEMFLMFSLGRPDVFSPGDLGLARAIEAIYGLPKNASREELERIAAAWAPYRTFASLALWRTRDATSPPTPLLRRKKPRAKMG